MTLRVEELKHGMPISFSFERGSTLRGHISIEGGGWVFLCHDNIYFSGSEAQEKFGHKYSWILPVSIFGAPDELQRFLNILQVTRLLSPNGVPID